MSITIGGLTDHDTDRAHAEAALMREASTIVAGEHGWARVPCPVPWCGGAEGDHESADPLEHIHSEPPRDLPMADAAWANIARYVDRGVAGVSVGIHLEVLAGEGDARRIAAQLVAAARTILEVSSEPLETA